MLRYRFVDPNYQGRFLIGTFTVRADKPGNHVFEIADSMIDDKVKSDFQHYCEVGLIVKEEAVTARRIIEEKRLEGDMVPELPVVETSEERRKKKLAKLVKKQY